MKKLLAVIFAVSMFICILLMNTLVVNAYTEQDGYFYWYNEDGITIAGVNSSVSGVVTIPSSINGYAVIAISSYAFEDCAGITEITIPDSVTSIGSGAFIGCSDLTKVTIGNGVTSIGDGAFEYCSNLTKVTIGNGVTSIGDGAFYDCAVRAVNITDISTWLNIDFGDMDANPLGNGGYLYLNGEPITDLTIPDGVVKIKDYAFYNYDGLNSITIPDSVTRIGESAFEGCFRLTDITIGSGVTSIGADAFKSDKLGRNVNITDISAWLNIDFEYNFETRGYNDANPLNDRGNLYLNGKLVTNLTIPDGVTKIKNYAFYGCSSLTAITIPGSVTSIGGYAFAYCENLASITIYDGTMRIESRAFFYNRAFSDFLTIKLPASVNYIGKEVFTANGFDKNKILLIVYENSHAHEYAISDEIQYKFFTSTVETPSAPTLHSKTDNSIVLKDVNGYEYKIEGGEWQRYTEFKGLSRDTDYVFYQRVAETETAYPSEVSAGVTIRTNNYTEGWKLDGIGWWYQYANGGYAIGWAQIGGSWYYFNASGYMVTGWLNDGGVWYYMSGSGAMHTGWLNDGGTWYYMSGSGAMATGWVSDGGAWYYMSGSGAMATGWQVIGGTWYYMSGSGAMATGWVSDGGAWYYMSGSGAMHTGWLNDGGTWYYMNSSGAMVSGWQQIGGTWYYFYGGGNMATGWILDGGVWYLLDSSGAWIG